MAIVQLVLPWPPSVNTYWGFHGHRRFLTKKAQEFKKDVAIAVQGQKLGQSRLSVTIIAHAPDKRVRDLDNILKPTLDALVQAGLFDDDSQVDLLTIQRGEIVKGGKAIVTVALL